MGVLRLRQHVRWTSRATRWSRAPSGRAWPATPARRRLWSHDQRRVIGVATRRGRRRRACGGRGVAGTATARTSASAPGRGGGGLSIGFRAAPATTSTGRGALPRKSPARSGGCAPPANAQARVALVKSWPGGRALAAGGLPRASGPAHLDGGPAAQGRHRASGAWPSGRPGGLTWPPRCPRSSGRASRSSPVAAPGGGAQLPAQEGARQGRRPRPSPRGCGPSRSALRPSGCPAWSATGGGPGGGAGGDRAGHAADRGRAGLPGAGGRGLARPVGRLPQRRGQAKTSTWWWPTPGSRPSRRAAAPPRAPGRGQPAPGRRRLPAPPEA